MIALRWMILFTVLGASSVAMADAFECKATETQPECHARLHCKAYEELEDCQKRLRAAAQNSSNNNGGNDNRGNDSRGNDRDSDRGNDRGNDRSDDRRSDRDDNRGYRERGDRGGRSSGRRRGRRGGGGGRSFEANKTFGLGLELGEPTGLNGKVFVSPSGAIDFGLGGNYHHYYYENASGLNVYVDYLWHPVSLASTPALELPFYVGVGVRFWDFDYCYQRVCDYGGSAIGIRVPLGLSFDFNNVPLDIFLQVVPVLDFLRGDYYDRYRDRNHLAIDGSVGIRFWFK